MANHGPVWLVPSTICLINLCAWEVLECLPALVEIGIFMTICFCHGICDNRRKVTSMTNLWRNRIRHRSRVTFVFLCLHSRFRHRNASIHDEGARHRIAFQLASGMRRPSHVAAIRGIHVGCDVADDVYSTLDQHLQYARATWQSYLTPRVGISYVHVALHANATWPKVAASRVLILRRHVSVSDLWHVSLPDIATC